jgi:hypothetical protein
MSSLLFKPVGVEGTIHVYLTERTFLGELYTEADGYYVLQFADNFKGYIPAWILRALADKLDDLNAAWDEEVHKFNEGNFDDEV